VLVIITDLDGTLLDERTYTPGPAAAVIARILAAGVTLVCCSSKTRAEIEALQPTLGLSGPFICENGGALWVPEHWPARRPAPDAGRSRWQRIELGRPYGEVVAIVRKAAASAGVGVQGFADMSVLEVAGFCGLTPLQAQLAKIREYDEPFRVLDADDPARLRFMRQLRRDGLTVTEGGRFFHASGDTDKGRAVRALRSLFPDPQETVFAGLGDALNDERLLHEVDIPIIVRREDPAQTRRLAHAVPGASITIGTGPQGWAAAVTRLLDQWLEGQRVLSPRGAAQ
jgi:mannosyl-3-phosphoglycerate phosphatase family protein